MKLPNGARRPLVIALAVVIAVVAVMAFRATRRDSPAAAAPLETVERRDITVTIEATGTVEPVELIEVKSKASGQILRMPVQVGSQVAAGDLLVQIDPRDVQNQYDQALAALRAAQAKTAISRAQKKRSDDLFAQAVITADEHEAATLEDANAQAQIVTARTNLDLAKQRRDDATVRAPSAGTILSQPVASGQVIASATSSASGGTVLLTMADLGRIRLRALVSETDIGSVHPGQTANVSVEAFPQRSFEGVVEKIEPQAVVQQSVTMFPVLISIANDQRLLLPGMNGEVSMTVDRREDVLAVPIDAVRSAREVLVVAKDLGLDPDSVQAQVARQIAARGSARIALRAGGDSAGGASRTWGSGRGGEGADSLRGRGGRGRRRGGLAADSTGALRSGAVGGRRGVTVTGASTPAATGDGAGTGGWTGGGGAAGRASRAQVVLVKTEKGLVPRVVRLGLSDFDYAEVLNGLEPGEQVALLSVTEAQAQRSQTQDRIRQRMGSGLPGTQGGGGGGGSGQRGGGR